jgi:uncharacterized protein (DUF1330 family)
MAAFIICNDGVITDAAKFDTYRQQAGPLIERFDGRILVRGGAVTNLEGDFGLNRVVVVEFDDVAAARRFYDRDEYKPLISLRHSSSICDAVIVEGSPPVA